MSQPQRTRRNPEPTVPDAAQAAEKNTSCASRIPGSALPPIPGKRYFAIGEVAELCGVKAHVLRYWEQEFAELAPVKRTGNRRFYQHRDVLTIRRIRSLLYEQGFTIEGARHQLAGRDEQQDQAGSRLLIRQLIAELEELRRIL